MAERQVDDLDAERSAPGGRVLDGADDVARAPRAAGIQHLHRNQPDLRAHSLIWGPGRQASAAANQSGHVRAMSIAVGRSHSLCPVHEVVRGNNPRAEIGGAGNA